MARPAPTANLNPDLLGRARAAGAAGRGPESRAWLALAAAVSAQPPSRPAILLSAAALSRRAGEREVAARLVVKALSLGAPTRACLIAGLRPGPPPDPLQLVSSGSTPCD